jgi:methylase of polypeptide subunit release factors
LLPVGELSAFEEERTRPARPAACRGARPRRDVDACRYLEHNLIARRRAKSAGRKVGRGREPVRLRAAAQATPVDGSGRSLFSYQFILSRRRTKVPQAAGLRLTVPPTVFHPRYFPTSEFFAAFIAGLDLAGKRDADVGTGTGILASAATRAGTGNVLAIDINPNAAKAAAENAAANGLQTRVVAMCSDLFSGFSNGEFLDVVLSNPPFFVGEPLDLAELIRESLTSQILGELV